MIGFLVAGIMLGALVSATETGGGFRYITGRGTVYKLDVTQDVTLQRPTSNYKWLQHLLVSNHPGWPNKRALVQFENVPRSCLSSKIISAKMYLYYEYAHKASWHSIYKSPFVPRYLQVHRVKKSWNQAQATSTKRDNLQKWSTQYLGLDDNDAEALPQAQPVTIFPARPRGFVEFDITRAVLQWRCGAPNYGVVIRATNELQPGRDIRFTSTVGKNKWQHPYAMVLCE